MALEVGELLVKIEADLTNLTTGLDQANSKLEGFSAGTIAKGTLIADAIKKIGTEALAFCWDSIKAYGENEAAVTRLETALRNEGLEVGRTSKDLQEYARQLQTTTQYSDETSMEMMALLTTFGVTGEQMKQTLRAAMDLSQGLGIDLRTATMMLGKAALGETGTLSRYGIVIGDNVPKAQALAAVLDQVNSRFGGSTQAAVGNVTTRIAMLKNQFDELKEVVGKMVLPVFEYYTQKLLVISTVIDGVKGTMKNLGMAALELAKEILQVCTTFGPLQSILSAFGVTGKQSFQAIDAAINAQMAKLNEWGKEETKVIAKSETNLKGRNRLQERLDSEEEALRRKRLAKESADTDTQTANLMTKYQTRWQLMVALQTVTTARQASVLNAYLSEQEQAELLDQVKRLEQQGKFNDAKILMEQATQKATEKMAEDQNKELQRQNQVRMANLSSTLNFISTLSAVKNKELAAIGKAAAIANATMDTYAAASKALNATPWSPANIALMAVVIAAGMANVAKISGVQLAKGGVVMPQEGGVNATLAEAGSAEAVIPLGDSRATDALRKTLGSGGSNITVQISGNFIEGSPSKMQKLVREHLVPEIRRLTDISPKGPFSRRRGRSS
jgi:hypothetical protein